MKILSKSITNLLSKSKFASHSSNSFRKIQAHTPTFVKPQNKLLVVHEHKRSWYISSLPTEDNYNNNNNRYRTFPAHGLGDYPHFCPSASCKSLLFGYMDFQPALWNPTTGEVKTLPKSSVPRPPSVTQEFSYIYGFGFDPASQDYKVIRFLEFDYEDDPDQVELYSLGTDSWKEIPYSYNDTAIPACITDPIHINGFHYWGASFCGKYVILPFDYANESFYSTHIPMPETDKLMDSPPKFWLAEFEGSLAVVAYAYADELETDAKPFEFEIWVWSNDERSWTRVSTIDVPDAVERPMGLFKNDHLYYTDLMGEVKLFDCAKGNLKNLGLKGDQETVVRMFPYFESLKPIGASQTGDEV